MGARSKARKRALDILFEADQRGIEPLKLIADRQRRGNDGVVLPEYAITLVEGVIEESVKIDELLSTYSHGWTIERMPAVDRAVLRLGTWELLFNRTCRTQWRSTRRSSWPAPCRRTTRRDSSTVCSDACWRSRHPEPGRRRRGPGGWLSESSPADPGTARCSIGNVSMGRCAG